MPLFFVQFGAFDAAKFRHAVDTVPIKVAEVSIQVGPLAGNYQQVPRLFEALEMLLQGATLCVSVLGEEGEVRWMLLFAPKCYGFDDSDVARRLGIKVKFARADLSGSEGGTTSIYRGSKG